MVRETLVNQDEQCKEATCLEVERLKERRLKALCLGGGLAKSGSVSVGI